MTDKTMDDAITDHNKHQCIRNNKIDSFRICVLNNDNELNMCLLNIHECNNGEIKNMNTINLDILWIVICLLFIIFISLLIIFIMCFSFLFLSVSHHFVVLFKYLTPCCLLTVFEKKNMDLKKNIPSKLTKYI